MCDYSLSLVASRPAKTGEKLVTTKFRSSATRGFASVDDLDVAVCLRPGTELAFEQDVRSDSSWRFHPRWYLGHTLARFRQINMDQPNAHHDALELADGQLVLLTALCEGQRATILQLPADPRVKTADVRRRADLAV